VDNVVDFEDQKNKRDGLYPMTALCLSCHNRWIALCPPRTNTFMIECPSCHAEDSFAAPIPPGFTD
jgi:hypothetical protein